MLVGLVVVHSIGYDQLNFGHAFGLLYKSQGGLLKRKPTSVKCSSLAKYRTSRVEISTHHATCHIITHSSRSVCVSKNDNYSL